MRRQQAARLCEAAVGPRAARAQRLRQRNARCFLPPSATAHQFASGAEQHGAGRRRRRPRRCVPPRGRHRRRPVNDTTGDDPACGGTDDATATATCAMFDAEVSGRAAADGGAVGRSAGLGAENWPALEAPVLLPPDPEAVATLQALPLHEAPRCRTENGEHIARAAANDYCNAVARTAAAPRREPRH